MVWFVAGVVIAVALVVGAVWWLVANDAFIVVWMLLGACAGVALVTFSAGAITYGMEQMGWVHVQR